MKNDDDLLCELYELVAVYSNMATPTPKKKSMCRWALYRSCRVSKWRSSPADVQSVRKSRGWGDK